MYKIENYRYLDHPDNFRKFFGVPFLGVAVYWISDKTWLECNEAFCKMLGYSRKELESLTWVDLTHPHDLADNVRLFETAIAPGGDDSYTLEKRFIRRDGSVLHARIQVMVNRDDRCCPIYNTLIVQDISDQVDATRRLEAMAVTQEKLIAERTKRLYDSEQRLSLSIAAGGIGTWSYYPTSGFLDLDNQSRKILKLSENDGFCTLEEFLAVVVPDQRAVVRDALSGANSNEPNGLLEFRCTLRDGLTTYINAGYRLLTDEYGASSRIIGVFRDVTAKKMFEEHLERDRQAAISNSKIKSQFIARVSHDLRTPLNSIIGFADIMAAQMFGPHGDAKYGEYSSLISDAGVYLLQLVDDILDISRIEAGGMQIEEMVFDLGELVGEVSLLVDTQCSEMGLSISTTMDDCFVIRGDRRRLKQVLSNLVSNAIKFTPRGGRIDVALRQLDDGSAMVSVHDTGCGIAADELPHVMTPYMQAGNALPGRPRGLGLGLAIADAIMRGHGGRLRIESKPGVGTTVACILPPYRIVPSDALVSGLSTAAADQLGLLA